MKINKWVACIFFVLGGCATTLNTTTMYYYDVDNNLVSEQVDPNKPVEKTVEVIKNKLPKNRKIYLCKFNHSITAELTPISDLNKLNYPSSSIAIEELGKIIADLRGKLIKQNQLIKNVECKNYSVLN